MSTTTETVVTLEAKVDTKPTSEEAYDPKLFPTRPNFDDKAEEREFLKGRLALAFRIFANLGFDEGVAGHITLRVSTLVLWRKTQFIEEQTNSCIMHYSGRLIILQDPVDPHTFWVNPFGVDWETLKASDLLRVNQDGKVIDGGPVKLLNTAAYMIHHAGNVPFLSSIRLQQALTMVCLIVHAARPEVNAVAHSHSLYGRTFCSLGRALDITTQDSCAFYNVRTASFVPYEV